MPQIDLVPVMRKAPAQCFVCHTTPNGPDGKPLPAIDLNTDYDWGQFAYLCNECVRVIGELAGFVTPEEHEELIAKHADLVRRHKNLRKRYTTLSDRTQKIVSGRRAERKVA
jgi:hypothetical protein